MKAKIKEGAKIFHDHGFFHYPNLKGGEVADLDTIFEVEAKHSYWDCRAHGYGIMDKPTKERAYGSGSIFVLETDDIIEVTG